MDVAQRQRSYIQKSDRHQIVKLQQINSAKISLQLGLAALASDGALDEAVGVRLGSKDGGILAQILDALVP